MVTLFLKSFSRPGFEHGNVVFFNLSQDLTALQWPRVDPIVSSWLVEPGKLINIFFSVHMMVMMMRMRTMVTVMRRINEDDNKPDKLIGVHPVPSRLGSSAQRKCQSLEGWERSTCQPWRRWGPCCDEWARPQRPWRWPRPLSPSSRRLGRSSARWNALSTWLKKCHHIRGPICQKSVYKSGHSIGLVALYSN